jgi:hypothetical protein
LTFEITSALAAQPTRPADFLFLNCALFMIQAEWFLTSAGARILENFIPQSHAIPAIACL